MAELTRADIVKLARLARLGLTEEEITLYAKELTAVLQYVEMLSNFDSAGLQPTSQVTGLVNVTRSDVVSDYGLDRQQLLGNVPQIDNDQIKVKRMIV